MIIINKAAIAFFFGFLSIVVRDKLRRENIKYREINDIAWKIREKDYIFYLNEIIPTFSLINTNIQLINKDEEFIKCILLCFICTIQRYFIAKLTILPPIKNYSIVKYKYLNIFNQVDGNDYIFSGHVGFTFILNYFISKKLAFILSILETITSSISRQHYTIDGIFAIIICHYTIIIIDIDNNYYIKKLIELL